MRTLPYVRGAKLEALESIYRAVGGAPFCYRDLPDIPNLYPSTLHVMKNEGLLLCLGRFKHKKEDGKTGYYRRKMWKIPPRIVLYFREKFEEEVKVE